MRFVHPCRTHSPALASCGGGCAITGPASPPEAPARVARWSRPSALTLLILALLGNSGCSFTFVHRAPDRARKGELVDCTETRAFPILDTAVAVAYPVGAAIRFSAGDVRRGDGTVDPAPPPALLFPLALAGGALFGWSAYTGFRQTAHCSEVRETYRSSQLLRAQSGDTP